MRSAGEACDSPPRGVSCWRLSSPPKAPSPRSISHVRAIDETSVYRNLEVLERHGLIRHVHLGHGPGLYALVGRHEVEYLYCERCGKVTAVTPSSSTPSARAIKKRFGYQPRFTHFAIVGLCEQCADQAPTSLGSDHGCTSGARVSPARSTRDENLHSHGGYVHSHSHATSGAKQQPAR